MSIEWKDVLKLSVPFVTAVLLVWIRTWVHDYQARKAKHKALTRLIKDVIQMLPDDVATLARVAESSRKGNIRLVSFDIPSLISKFACDLSELDTKRAYFYSDLVSSIEIVNKGLVRLRSLILERIKVDATNLIERLDLAISTQANIIAHDLVSFSNSALKVMEEIPKWRRNADSQSMKNLERKIESAKKELEG